MRRRKANWIGHILRRTCLLKHVIGGKQLLDDLKEKKIDYNLREEATDRTRWRTGFVRGNGPVANQSTQ
jgi:hypothetical protein